MRLSRSLSVATSLVFVGFIILFSGTPASTTYAGRNGRTLTGCQIRVCKRISF